MAYADIEDVQARNPVRRPYTASSAPNIDQVNKFIDEAAGEIDQALTKAGYAAPISTTAPSSVLLTLRKANAVGGAYYAEWAAPNSDRREELEDMWQTALKMLASSELAMPKDYQQSRARSAPVASPPFFTRDMVL